jgi:hypothetical protein
MNPKVARFRPRQADTVTEAVKLLLDLPLGLSDAVKHGLSEVLGQFAPPESWGFIMLNPEQQRAVLRAINRGEKPALTLRIWNVAISYLRYDTGEVMAGRVRLARDAETSPQEASRALTRLTEIGALTRLKQGHYAINPHVGWQGSLIKREEAGKKTAMVVIGT